MQKKGRRVWKKKNEREKKENRRANKREEDHGEDKGLERKRIENW